MHVVIENDRRLFFLRLGFGNWLRFRFRLRVSGESLLHRFPCCLDFISAHASGFALLFFLFFKSPALFLFFRSQAHGKSCGFFIGPSLFDPLSFLPLEAPFFFESSRGRILRIARGRPFLLPRQLDFTGLFFEAVNAGIAVFFSGRGDGFGVDHFFYFDLLRLLLLTAQCKS